LKEKEAILVFRILVKGLKVIIAGIEAILTVEEKRMKQGNTKHNN